MSSSMPQEYDETGVEEVVLALLHLNSFIDHGRRRAWKSHDWDALDRLYARGLIEDPKTRAKSVLLTEEGERLAAELFDRHFRDDR